MLMNQNEPSQTGNRRRRSDEVSETPGCGFLIVIANTLAGVEMSMCSRDPVRSRKHPSSKPLGAHRDLGVNASEYGV